MFVGREKEIAILKEALSDDKSHFIAIYGRRRIGKTFLIREFFNNQFVFFHSGLSKGNQSKQISSFVSSIEQYGLKVRKKPRCWLDAFNYVKDLVLNSNDNKKVIFIDELSWLDSRNSDLMVALENFWNSFASARKDVVLIVCSSATSWMISNVIHNKDGLYNRLTKQIELKGFNLKECEEYVLKKGLVLNRNQILHYYMIFGGIPYYWDFIEKGYSVTQNIDNILFKENAPLKYEYDYLYSAIFKRPDDYLKIVKTLATKKIGMTREEIIQNSGIGNSGSLSRKLEELERCGFIRKYTSFGSKKNSVYQLVDYFTLFYYKFMANQTNDPNFWTNQLNTPSINNWLGLAFERVCFDHINQIKNKLGISGVLTSLNSWQCKKDLAKGLNGSQIDLMIVRKDQIINLCEIKYSESEYTITEKLDNNIRNKISDLKTATKTKYAIHPTMITCNGLVDNAYSKNIQAVIVLNDLFRELS